jgi:hypothetical protein
MAEALRLLQEVSLLRESERKLQGQLQQSRRATSTAILKLAVKERETHALQQQAAALRQAATPQNTQSKELLMDPAINAEVCRLREELKAARDRERELRQELEATQFQPGAIAGKKLMQKCKELQAENEQLGKEVSEGRVQKLRAEAALQKDYAQELRKSLGETREWVEQLDEELGVAQAVIFSLRRELAALKKT